MQSKDEDAPKGQMWIAPVVAVVLAAAAIGFLPVLGSTTGGWDGTAFPGAVGIAVSIVIGGWAIQQAISSDRQARAADRQVAGLQRQNELIARQLRHAEEEAERSRSEADAQRDLAQHTLRGVLEQRLDQQMPTVSLRLKEFAMRPILLNEPSSGETDDEADQAQYREQIPLYEIRQLMMHARLEIRNHDHEPVMMTLLQPSIGGYDEQPSSPLGGAGMSGLWGDDAESNIGDGARRVISWEHFYSPDLMRERLRHGGWDGESWRITWSIRVTNLQGSVVDVLRFHAEYRPFREFATELEQEWAFDAAVKVGFYGSYATERSRTYVALEAPDP